MSWINGPFIGFDTETTGVNPNLSRLVTASIITRGPEGDVVQNWLANPGVEIPQAATDIHGITTEYARFHGAPIKDVLEDVAGTLSDYLKNGYPIVAFNAGYDIGIMEAELKRHGLPTLTDRTGGVRPVIDPLVLDRALDRYRRGPRRLSNLMTVYGVVTDQSMHDAEVDTRATLDLLQQMLQKYPDLSSKSLDELHEYQIEKHRDWAVSFEKFLRGKGQDVDIEKNWLP